MHGNELNRLNCPEIRQTLKWYTTVVGPVISKVIFNLLWLNDTTDRDNSYSIKYLEQSCKQCHISQRDPGSILWGGFKSQESVCRPQHKGCGTQREHRIQSRFLNATSQADSTEEIRTLVKQKRCIQYKSTVSGTSQDTHTLTQLKLLRLHFPRFYWNASSSSPVDYHKMVMRFRPF